MANQPQGWGAKLQISQIEMAELPNQLNNIRL